MLNLLGEQQVSSTQGKIQRALEVHGTTPCFFESATVRQ